MPRLVGFLQGKLQAFEKDGQEEKERDVDKTENKDEDSVKECSLPQVVILMWDTVKELSALQEEEVKIAQTTNSLMLLFKA